MKSDNPSALFNIDGIHYSTGDLTSEAQKIWESLLFARRKLNSLENQLALLAKAKNGYIVSLSEEIVTKRSGVDLSALLSDN